MQDVQTEQVTYTPNVQTQPYVNVTQMNEELFDYSLTEFGVAFLPPSTF